MVDACETPMEDHIKRFHELLKVPGAIVRVDTPNPLGYDTAHFGEGFACSLSLHAEAEKRAREEAATIAIDRLAYQAQGYCKDAKHAESVADELRRLLEKEKERADKFMWQVRDTCARAEAAETHSAALAGRVEGAKEPAGCDYSQRYLPNWRWPWSLAWWKPTNRRRDLVKAGALILAEIERIDRAGGDNGH